MSKYKIPFSADENKEDVLAITDTDGYKHVIVNDLYFYCYIGVIAQDEGFKIDKEPEDLELDIDRKNDMGTAFDNILSQLKSKMVPIKEREKVTQKDKKELANLIEQNQVNVNSAQSVEWGPCINLEIEIPPEDYVKVPESVLRLYKGNQTLHIEFPSAGDMYTSELFKAIQDLPCHTPFD